MCFHQRTIVFHLLYKFCTVCGTSKSRIVSPSYRREIYLFQSFFQTHLSFREGHVKICSIQQFLKVLPGVGNRGRTVSFSILSTPWHPLCHLTARTSFSCLEKNTPSRALRWALFFRMKKSFCLDYNVLNGPKWSEGWGGPLLLLPGSRVLSISDTFKVIRARKLSHSDLASFFPKFEQKAVDLA